MGTTVIDTLNKLSKTRTRRHHSIDFKRQVIRQSMEPGVSIAAVAMAHGINPNQLQTWRRLHLAGDLELIRTAPILLPVSVSEQRNLVKDAPDSARCPPVGSIEILINDVHIILHGEVSANSLRIALEALRP
jgi:transposase